MRFSLVIPAYQEEAMLPRLLDSVATARARYRHGSAEIEVVVADNGSTDRTADIARGQGCIVANVEKRVIGAARNGGARSASGEILCFVDADSIVHPDTFNCIDDAIAKGGVVAGATGVRLERMSLGIGLTWALMLPLLYIGGVDSGVVFCRKSDWEAVGGYPETRLFAEDMEFLFALKRLGRRRGERFVRVKAAKAITSTRKFDERGDWHYLATAGRALYWLLFSPQSLKRFAHEYWYERRPRAPR